MAIDKALSDQIAEQFRSSQRALVTTHIHPDGDAIGSLLGIGLALQELGKEVQMVLNDGIPSNLKFLPGCDQIRSRPEGIQDLVLVVDCSDMDRIGNALNGVVTPDINIDHHATNLNFARYNLVDTHAVATTEIIADLLSDLGVPLSQPSATALMVGLITDTIGFRTAGMTPKVLRLAANLMDLGVDLPDLYRRTLVSRSFEAVQMWGVGLSKLERDERMAWTTLTLSDRQSVHYSGRDDADLINLLTIIDGIDIALIFLEQTNGIVKVSWRAQPGFDVSRVAVGFGGGGHPAASGAEIQGTLQDVLAAVLNRTRPLLEGGSNVQ
jgi:phosphoesterase RecJ-like protein